MQATTRREQYADAAAAIAANPALRAADVCKERGLSLNYYYSLAGKRAKKSKVVKARRTKPLAVPAHLDHAHTTFIPELPAGSGKTTLIVVQTTEPLNVLRQLFS